MISRNITRPGLRDDSLRPTLLRTISRMIYGTALIGGLLLCTSLAHAGNEAIILRNGEVIGGKVISFNDQSVVFEVSRNGQTQRLTIGLDKIQPGSIYDLKAARVKQGDAAAHMALAQWCMDRELPYFAMRQYDKAILADPAVKAKAEDGKRKARLARGRNFYTRAVAAMQARRYKEASRLFAIVVRQYPTPFGGPAQKALDFIAQQKAKPTARAGAAGGAAGGAAPARKGAAPVKGALDARSQAQLNQLARQLRTLAQHGYYAKTDSRARRYWRDASKVADQALAILDLARQAGRIDDDALQQLRAPLVTEAVDLCLQIAVIYLREDNEYGAQRWLARALLLDPQNQRAQELRLYVVTEFRNRNPRRTPGGLRGLRR